MALALPRSFDLRAMRRSTIVSSAASPNLGTGASVTDELITRTRTRSPAIAAQSSPVLADTRLSSFCVFVKFPRVFANSLDTYRLDV